MHSLRSVAYGRCAAPVKTTSRKTVLQAFLSNPITTGALVASGARLSRTLAVNGQVDSAGVVLELGAGTGVVTEEIARHVSHGTRIISMELDYSLAYQAQIRCPEAEVFNSDALYCRQVLDKLGLPHCDSVISCIPWANMSGAAQDSLLDAVSNVLKPGGSFTAFAYLHGKPLPGAKNFLGKLYARYDTVERSNIIWANFPPAIVYRASQFS